MKNNIFKKITILLLLISILISSLSVITVIADSYSTEEPDVSTKGFTVINNGIDETESYNSTNTINIKANTRGTLGNIYYYGGSDNCTYYYSADICIENDTSTYGSIRLVLGNCQYENYKKNIEVCLRPTLGGQTVFFLNGNGEYAVKVGNSQNDIKVGDTFNCLAKYDYGKVSFWVNDILIFDNIALPYGATDVNLQAGFYSQNCTGTMSNIKIWGDAEVCVCPEIGDNLNLIYDIAIKDKLTNVYKKANDGYLSYSGVSTNRTVFYGIEYGDEYSLNTKARFNDNKNLNGSSEVNWEGLIFNVATATSEGQSYDIELRVRKHIAVVFAVEQKNNPSEKVIFIQSGKTIEYGNNYNYALKYYKDGTFSLWVNGDSYLNHFDLSKYDYTNTKPCVALGGEVCSYSFEDIKLWGDISVDSSAFESDAKLNDTDFNLDYDLSFPEKPEDNKNYITDSQIYTKENKDGSLNTNIYLDYLSLRKIKRINDTDLGTLEFALNNPGIATDFNSADEVTYDFYYTADNKSEGSLSLYARYFYETNNTLNFVLDKNNITVNNGGNSESFSYPENASFTGNHRLTLKMNGKYAVLYIDGVYCAKKNYKVLSVPMLTFITENVTINTHNAVVYKNISGTDTVYDESRYEMGDTNKDDNINLKDLVHYKKILSEAVSVYDKSVSDINDDNKIDGVDISSFRIALMNDLLGLGGDMELFHDQSEFYLSDIEPDFGQSVEYTLRVKYGSVTDASVQISTDGTNWDSFDMHYDRTDESGDYQYFKGTVPGQNTAYYYRFEAKNNFKGTTQTLKGVNTTSVGGWFMMVGQKTPDWAKGTLWYSFLPDTFFNGDLTNDKLNSGSNTVNSWNNVHTGLSDRYGGDLIGVSEKLDYLKALGVESIYMNPISKSYQNAGYGTVDYNQIDPAFGDADAVTAMVNAIHNKDMRVMTDVVLYFSPYNSIYVNKDKINPLAGALQSATSPFTEMLKFTDWPNYEVTEWGGLYTDLFNTSLQNLLYKTQNSAMQRMLREYKFDGFRFDCGGYLGSKTDSGLRNTLMKDIRKHLKEANPEMLMLSEYDYTNMTKYSWDSQWNLDLRSAFDVFITGELMSGQTYSTTVSSLRNVMLRSLYKLPRQQSLTVQNMISFHDDDRIDTNNPRGKAITLIQMTYLGSPVIYYGQEIGLERELQNGVSQNGHAGTSFYSMDWNEKNWNQDMLSFYKKIGEIRKNNTAIKTGALEEIVCDNSLNLLGFARYNDKGTVITLANSGEKIDNYNFSVSKFGLKDGSILTDCFSGENYVVINGKVSVSIPEGGTLLSSSVTKTSDSEEKSASMIGAGYVTADVSGEGSYSISINENEKDTSTTYKAVINGEKVYVNAKRAEGSELIKQTEFTLPENAELRLNRNDDNIYYCSYYLDGKETIIDNSAMGINMNSKVEAKVSCLSGYVIPEKITVVNDDNISLYDGFDSVIPKADWIDFSEKDAEIAEGNLILNGGTSISKSVPDEDWTAETKITSGKGAISVHKDSENYLELRYQDSLQFVLVTDNTEEILSDKHVSAENGIYLQISRVGTDYAAYYSLDGTQWNTIGKPIYYNPSVVTVSLSAKTETAKFDYFMFGDGVTEFKPHIFGGENFAYTEKRTEPCYSIKSGDFEYTAEGIKSTTSDISLMSIDNISYNDFYAQVNLNVVGSSTKAGLTFGMNNYSSVGAYTLYRNSNTLILKYGTHTLKRINIKGDRITVYVRNGVLSVYNDSPSVFLYSISLPDYNGGYVGFFSENGEGVFANYYVGNISDNWIAVSGDVSGSTKSVSTQSISSTYGSVAYRGYAFTDGTLRATLSNDRIIDSSKSYASGIMLGSSFGKSPDKNGVTLAIEDGKAVLRYKGEIIDSYILSQNTMDIEVTLESGKYTININNGEKTMECFAPDCAAGCITLYAINAKSTLKNCYVDQ